MADEPALNAVELAAEITIAWLGNQNNRVSADDVPAFLRTMHSTVTDLAAGAIRETNDMSFLHEMVDNILQDEPIADLRTTKACGP